MTPTTPTICEWCGHDHPREALCTKRPRLGRRGFLALCGMGLVGLALPAPAMESTFRVELLGGETELWLATADFPPSMMQVAVSWHELLDESPREFVDRLARQTVAGVEKL